MAVRVSIVNYLNSKPFLHGLVESGLAKSIELHSDVPAICAEKLRAGTVDVGLVPVAAIPEIAKAMIITPYCIGTLREVKTVCLYAACPIDEVQQVYLDYESRSSVALTRILMRHHWQLLPEYLTAAPGYEALIQGSRAGVVIGDRAIQLADTFPYIYDLGVAWHDWTGLPFVYAAWVANVDLPSEFLLEFEQALALGLSQLPKVAALYPKPHPDFDTLAYYTRYISYTLDEPKRKAIHLFHQHLEAEKNYLLV